MHLKFLVTLRLAEEFFVAFLELFSPISITKPSTVTKAISVHFTARKSQCERQKVLKIPLKIAQI